MSRKVSFLWTWDYVVHTWLLCCCYQYFISGCKKVKFASEYAFFMRSHLWDLKIKQSSTLFTVNYSVIFYLDSPLFCTAQRHLFKEKSNNPIKEFFFFGSISKPAMSICDLERITETNWAAMDIFVLITWENYFCLTSKKMWNILFSVFVKDLTLSSYGKIIEKNKYPFHL